MQILRVGSLSDDVLATHSRNNFKYFLDICVHIKVCVLLNSLCKYVCECECLYVLCTKCLLMHCIALCVARRFGVFEYQLGRVIMEFENWCCLKI